MSESCDNCAKLRKALIGLVGAETVEELREMEATIRVMPAPEQDKVGIINAIHALIDTTPEYSNE